MVVCCKTDFLFSLSLSLSLAFLRRLFSLITFSLSVLVYMYIIENVKKQTKKICGLTALFSVDGLFDAVTLLPNQQEGTETGKESI